MTKTKTQTKTVNLSDNDLQTFSGARIILECLKKEGVKDIFGYPGGAVLPLYEEIFHCKEIKHYLVRHEQGAVHAAEGYARVTGKPGVVLVTSGPGACNTVTGITNAYYDGYPIVVFTGQVSSSLIGNDAFQEADIVGITRPVCKHNYLVKDVQDLPRIIKEAFHIATTGKPGPVLIDLPKDVLGSVMEFKYPETIKLPGYNPTYIGHPVQINKALNMLYNAERPVILSGGGVVSSDASELVVKIAKAFKIPVANTLMGTGSFPGEDDLSLGLTGMHGNYWANLAISECDVLFNIGSRFSDRVTGDLDRYCPKAKIIHVDIDPCSISKNVPVDIPIVGCAKNVLSDMIENIDKKELEKSQKLRASWLKQIAEWKQMKPKSVPKSDKLTPQQVISKIYEVTKNSDALVATEVGQHQMWTALLYKFKEPRRFVSSGGLGTMGFGFPSAMGAQVAYPDRLVLNIAGDGSIQMNIQELATCVEYKLPVKVCVINNGYLGMVRQWQGHFYNDNYSETLISGPDFVKLAEAYGAAGFRVTKEEEIEPTLKKAIETDGPVFIDFIVEPMEAVYPWVLAGDPIDKILLGDSEKE
ncbi:MAG: biosynthetic-type acetolactate synthase large subunit [Cyanobacteriota bacterium]